MSISRQQFEEWLNQDESEKLEFKEAKNSFSVKHLLEYCCALANEKGGRLVFGVTNKKPRQIAGTNAFRNLDKIKQRLISELNLRIGIHELDIQSKRVLIFDVPSRPLGIPKKVNNIYWMRSGESLVSMTEDKLLAIFHEAVPDYSAQICPKATLDDLSGQAIEEFRNRWIQQSGNKSLKQHSILQLLQDAELTDADQVTYAALVLFGNSTSLSRLLSQAEVIFEYRSGETAGPAGQRTEFREGFFLYYEKLWNLINLRNELQHFQDDLFMRRIPTFSEGSIREAILNAVSHRDYQNPGSIFIRQYPDRIRIESPGGFPAGITAENILNRQSPRNRRIAETLAKCGLVERSGQGADRMFEESVSQGKDLPDFSDSDAYQVNLILSGKVRDVSFLKFLEKISQSRNRMFSAHELIVLNKISKNERLSDELRTIARLLREEGVLELIGRTKFILNRRYYELADKKGIYTRKKGLDSETNRHLLLKHIRENAKTGSPFHELQQVLPSLSRHQIYSFLRKLKKEGKISNTGKTRSSLWFPCSSGNASSIDTY